MNWISRSPVTGLIPQPHNVSARKIPAKSVLRVMRGPEMPNDGRDSPARGGLAAIPEQDTGSQHGRGGLGFCAATGVGCFRRPIAASEAASSTMGADMSVRLHVIVAAVFAALMVTACAQKEEAAAAAPQAAPETEVTTSDTGTTT